MISCIKIVISPRRSQRCSVLLEQLFRPILLFLPSYHFESLRLMYFQFPCGSSTLSFLSTKTRDFGFRLRCISKPPPPMSSSSSSSSSVLLLPLPPLLRGSVLLQDVVAEVRIVGSAADLWDRKDKKNTKQIAIQSFTVPRARE